MSSNFINQFEINKINVILRKLNRLKKNIKISDHINLRNIDIFKDFNDDLELLKDQIDYLNIKLVGKKSNEDDHKIELYNRYNDLSSKYFCLILYYNLFLVPKNNYEFIKCDECNIIFKGPKYLEDYSEHLKKNH